MSEQTDRQYERDQEFLNAPIPSTWSTRERILKAREFAVDRRRFAAEAVCQAQRAEYDGQSDRANQLREEARVADAVAMGAENTLATLFDE